jgi:anti-anti-sigma factor
MGVGNAADALFEGWDGRGCFIAARGSVRASLCYALREGLLTRLEQSPDVPAVFVDLSQCDYMDSTFIGLLVAVDKRLHKGSGGRLHVVNPSPQCLDLLRQLGLVDLLLIDALAPQPPEMQEVEKAPGRPSPDFVLDAHKALMDTSEEARKKFSLLRDHLERKLRSEKPPADSH